MPVKLNSVVLHGPYKANDLAVQLNSVQFS